LCPSVVSFNSVIPRAQSFIVVTWASDLPLRTILFCCLRRNVEASCHKHFVVVSREKQMPPQQRLVSSTCHGPSQLRVLHLAVELEPFTARDGARYWLHENSDFCLPHLHLMTPLGGSPSEYCYNV